MEINTQPAEKQDLHLNSLMVNSIFYTIQGEGPFAGSPAVFVRLAGCNLQCPMCDTEYTKRTKMPHEEILKHIRGRIEFNFFGKIQNLTRLVVITGGEPFRQNLEPFVSLLLDFGYIVQIETNGSLYQNLPFAHPNLHIVCSPKAGTINKKLAFWISALKYVATVESLKDSPDGLPMHALEHPNGGKLARPPIDFDGPVYLQPVDEQDDAKNHANMIAVRDSCLKNNYRLCLQVHKIIGVE